MDRYHRLLESVLSSEIVDLEALRLLARFPGGFHEKSIRLRAWKALLGNSSLLKDNDDKDTFKSLIVPHKDEKQVECDVDRSLWNYSQNESWSEDYRCEKRKDLTNIILAVLSKHTHLNYFQGFHDIAAVFLQVLDDSKLAFLLTEHACLNYFPECMLPDFKVVALAIDQLSNLIKVGDRELYELLFIAGIKPFYAFSWIITWFAHDLKDLDIVTRLYDVMLSSAPCYSLYLSAAVVIFHRELVLSTECEFSALHNLLVHLPSSHPFPIDELLLLADELMLLVPVKSLVDIGDDEIRHLVVNTRVAMLEDALSFSVNTLDSESSSKELSAGEVQVEGDCPSTEKSEVDRALSEVCIDYSCMKDSSECVQSLRRRCPVNWKECIDLSDELQFPPRVIETSESVTSIENCNSGDTSKRQVSGIWQNVNVVTSYVVKRKWWIIAGLVVFGAVSVRRWLPQYR